MNEQQISQLTIYALKVADQTIAPEEFEELNSILSASPEAARHYNRLMMTISNFLERGEDIVCDEMPIEDILKETLWQEMADYEKTAQEIKIYHEKPRELITKVVYPPRERRKISKSTVFMLLNAAAVILIILLLRFVPPSGGIQVATLTDSLHAKWADVTSPMERGTKITAGNEWLLLREGLAELQFDTNARVVIEAPTEFQILASDQIVLRYGKVYATVPQEALGFTIQTQAAKVVDLGTAFGVQVNVDGDTALHVLEGKTILITGETSHKVSVEVNKDTAKSISGTTLKVSDIACKNQLFVREFDSEKNFVWRGQILDLADVVGGGNGFGTGTPGLGVNPMNGSIEVGKDISRNVGNQYVSVPSSLFIDGIFVPNGEQAQIVSSMGHQFTECPVTEAKFYTNVKNSPEVFRGLPVYLNDGNSGTQEDAFIFLHPNLGITFDLNAFRTSMSGVMIHQFKAELGISRSSKGLFKADFWVLVDGHVRYKRQGVQTRGITDRITVDITDTDRFLTLVTTDGGPIMADQNDPDYDRSWIGRDWCVFGKPVLVLE